MKKYYNYHVKKVVSVDNLITIEYIELTKNYQYMEETHSFYEIAYIDRGEIHCVINENDYSMAQGDFILIPPLSNHHYYSLNNATPSNVFITCFSCKSDFLELIHGKCSLDNELKKLLQDLLTETKNAFEFPFNKKLILKNSPLFGAQQLIESRIEEILIKLIRSKLNEENNIKFVMDSVEFENSLVNDIISLLKSSIYKQINLTYVTENTYYSKTYINNIFKKNIGYSIMQYFNLLKIKEAKKMLRQNMPSSEISEKLCFESPNYFTKVFKKYTGMTPSQYKKTSLA